MALGFGYTTLIFGTFGMHDRGVLNFGKRGLGHGWPEDVRNRHVATTASDASILLDIPRFQSIEGNFNSNFKVQTTSLLPVKGVLVVLSVGLALQGSL